MKLFKKTAALLFCLALVFSVMAISASADGPTFTVTLEQNSADTHVDHNDNTVAEYLNGATVVYDIKLSANQTVTVNALDFEVEVDEDGLAITTVEVGPVGSLQTITEGSGGKYAYAADRYGKAKFSLTANTPQVIGKLTLTVTDDAEAGSQPDFSLKNVSISETTIQLAAYTGNSVVVTGAEGVIEVDPEYTITILKPVVTSATGVIANNKTLDTTNSVSSGTLTYTLLTGTNGSALVNGPNIAGYHLTNADTLYAVASEEGEGNWAEDDEVSVGRFYNTSLTPDAIGNDTTEALKGVHWGNVTLRADYTATNYELTFDLNDTGSAAENTQFDEFDGDSFNTTSQNNDGVLTYTIENAATSRFFGVPTRTGYVFKGWTASDIDYADSDKNDTTTDDTTDYYTFWDEDTDYYYDADTTDQTPAPDTVGAFGSVTLTAQWEINGHFIQKNYKYAVTNELLTLFAVETDVVQGGVYYYSDNAMYIVDNAYEALFTGDDALPALASGKTYTIYGTIAGVVSESAVDNNITFKSAVNKGTDVNTAIVYNGKITGDAGDVINSGDFGTVDLLFASQSAYDNETVSIAKRLAANVMRTGGNVTTGEGAEATSAYWCGTIDDIAKIMDLAGTTASDTSIALAQSGG